MSLFPLKPTHAPVKRYYEALAHFHKLGHTTEGNTRSAFADLLKRCATPYGWHLVEEFQFKGTAKQPLRADGALIDELTLQHGLWEAKDFLRRSAAGDQEESRRRLPPQQYPLPIPRPRRPLSGHRIALDCDLTKPENLIEILELFPRWTLYQEFGQSGLECSHIPQLTLPDH
jgi:hypothetical protein